jgi:hypothetical protein
VITIGYSSGVQALDDGTGGGAVHGLRPLDTSVKYAATLPTIL